MIHRFLSALFLICCPLLLMAQSSSWGDPTIQVYKQLEYNGHIQNWSIAQDTMGLIYFGNQGGIIQYDGTHWKNISTPKNLNARAVHRGSDGRMYVAGSDLIGYIDHTEIGEPYFRSLKPLLPDSAANFRDIASIVSRKGEVIFSTYNYLYIFRISDTTLKALSIQHGFNRAFTLNNRVFVEQNMGIIHELVDTTLVPFDLTEPYTNIGVVGLFPFDETYHLAITRQYGMVKLSNNEVLPYGNPETNRRLRESRIYHATQFDDSTYIVSTLSGGAFFITQKGELIQNLTTEEGMPHNSVKFGFVDRDKNVWFACEQEVARAEWQSPARYLSSNHGYSALSWELATYKDNVLIGLDDGVYSLPISEINPSQKLSLFFDSNELINRLVPYKNSLIIAADRSLWVYHNSKSVERVSGNGEFRFASTFTYDKDGKDYFVAGFYDFSIFTNDNRSMVESVEKVSLPDYVIYDAYAMDDGWVWGATYQDNIIGIDLRDGFAPEVPVSKYMQTYQGKEVNSFQFIELFGELFSVSSTGMFYLNKDWRPGSTDSLFHPVPLFENLMKEFGAGTSLGIQAGDDHVFVALQGNKFYCKIDPSTIGTPYPTIQERKMAHFARDLGAADLVFAPPHYALASYTNHLGVFDLRTIGTYRQQPYAPLVRSVQLIGKDSLLYAGGYLHSELLPELDYTSNSIRFTFASPQYHTTENLRYRFYLEGFEDTYSAWDTETRKDYTNLSAGTYTFQIQSMNTYDEISPTSSFRFTILPPWYLTYWAYGAYLLLAVGVVFQIVQWQIGIVRKKEAEKARVKEMEHRAETAELQAKVAETQSKMIEIENNRRKTELETARELQRSFFPKKTLALSGFDIEVFHESATEVGGDYYDFQSRENGHLLFIGDATGHGLPAGMMVAITKAAGSMLEQGSPSELLQHLNSGIKSLHLRLLHMALMIVELSEKSPEVKLSSAGIPYALHYEASSNKVIPITAEGMPLGAMKRAHYTSHSFHMNSGDVLVLLTDGLPELQNETGEQLGYDRLYSFIEEVAHQPASEVMHDLRLLGDRWKGDVEQEDDITLMVIKKT